MSDFHLPTRYDVILCLFSSIGYVKTLDRVAQTLRCFRKHLAGDGVVILEPWFPPDKMRTGHHSERTSELPSILNLVFRLLHVNNTYGRWPVRSERVDS